MESKNLLLFKFNTFKTSTSKPEKPIKEVSEMVILVIFLIPVSKLTVDKIGNTFQSIEPTWFKCGAWTAVNEVNSLKEKEPPMTAKLGTLILTKLAAFVTVKSPLMDLILPVSIVGPKKFSPLEHWIGIGTEACSSCSSCSDLLSSFEDSEESDESVLLELWESSSEVLAFFKLAISIGADGNLALFLMTLEPIKAAVACVIRIALRIVDSFMIGQSFMTFKAV
ncbi:hypothetical protein WICPIJ_006885 [Wickerhamomyces pijperi]|uniref:Uncharacterized protein n=1 Tax=Wickerhamomyces pijperi TaxID=599730 RepID=A0A9P8Q186_WICPI|nr:hypothetical protein WICPIJ_006885 [Wickerhamomyces pijperi]